MLVTSLFLGGLHVLGFYLVYKKFPQHIRDFFDKRPLFTSLVAVISTYVILGGTILGLFGAAWAGIIISVMILASKNPYLMAQIERYKKEIISYAKKIETWHPVKDGVLTRTE